MALSLEDFAPVQTGQGQLCALGRLITYLDVEDAEVLTEVLSDLTITPARVAAVLRAKGYPMMRQTVTNHRNGACKC